MADFNANVNVGGGCGTAHNVDLNVGGGCGSVNPNVNVELGHVNVNVDSPKIYSPSVEVSAPPMAYNAHHNVGINVGGGYHGNMGGGYHAGHNSGYGASNVVVVNNAQMQMHALNEMMHPHVCGRPVPRIDPCSALAVLILNIFFPGFGTMICGCVPHYGSDNCMGDCCCFFWLGWLHFILWGILVGWILGIILGCQLIVVSAMDMEEMSGGGKIGVVVV